MIRAIYLLLLVGAVPLLAWNGLVQQINAYAADLFFRLQPSATSSSIDRIVLVAIDDDTARLQGPLPLRRSLLAEALTALRSAGPRIIVVDLLISEPGSGEDDRSLLQALRGFPNVIVGTAIESGQTTAPSWIRPLSELAEAARVAHVHAEPDPDGVVRSVLLMKEAEGERRWAMGLEAAAAFTAERPLATEDAVRLGAVVIPATRRDSRLMRINYAGPEATYDRVSMATLLNGSIDTKIFRDKIVIIGVTAQGSGDRHFTPVSAGIGMSGIEIHANVVRTILDEAFLAPLAIPWETILYILTAASCVLLAVRFRGLALAGMSSGLAALGITLTLLAFSQGTILPLGSLLAVFLASSGVAFAGEYASVSLALESSERRRREYAHRVQAIAHEIKNPLAAIQGSSEIVADNNLPEELRGQMAGLIHKESQRLNTLIRTFLDVERMAAGALDIRKQPVQVADLCRGVLDQARLYAAKKRITVESNLRPLEIQADPDLLAFALYNLLTNAVKYSPENTLVSLRVAESDGEATIAVADQGYGIAPEQQQRIFERFYRLRRDEQGSEEGTGIGLSLVREIVDQHGGTVEVESRVGAGSRFTLRIPKE